MTHLYDHLARVLAQEAPRACFALMGDANMALAVRLGEAGIRMIYVRHEHCAVAAAMAHARKTGEVGLATVTCGPGLTQLMTALPAAVRAGLPLLVIAGEAPLKAAWYNQAIDQAPFVTATGAAYLPLHHAARMPTALRDAMVQARSERRPVVVGLPFDLQEQPWTGADTLPTPSHVLAPKPRPIPPHPQDLAEAAARIARAERVVLLAGMGAVAAGAGPACAALAARIGALLATTLPARGLFHEDPFSIGIAGGFSTDLARERLGQADLIVSIGARLASHTTDKGSLWPQAEVLQIDTAPAALSQGRPVARSHLRADARLAAEALATALPEAPGWRSPALAHEIATRPADGHDTQAQGIDPRDAVRALDAALPQDWELVNSSGHCSYYFAQMPRRPQSRFLTIREFGAIGNGISFAMGVAVARPDRPVVLFDGDGSLLMHIQELETILRHGLKVLIVAFNDGGYGSEFHKLRAEGLPTEGATFGRTDLAAIARGFGADGVTVEDLAQIPALTESFAASNRATVWDIPIDDTIASPVIRRAHP